MAKLFHHHAQNDSIRIESGAQTYIDRVEAFGRDNGAAVPPLPAGAIERIYEPGIRHAISNGGSVIAAGPMPWPWRCSDCRVVVTPCGTDKTQCATFKDGVASNGHRQNLRHRDHSVLNMALPHLIPLSERYYAYVFDKAGDELPLHDHPFTHDTVVTSGKVEWFSERRREVVEAWHVIMFPVGVRHGIVALSAGATILQCN